MNVTKVLTNRDALGYWLNENGLLGEGAEIGCHYGTFSELILSTWKGQKLYMVDPWCRQSSEIYKEKHDYTDFDAAYAKCVALYKNDNRANLIKALSVDASKMIQNGSLDWVYIDGNHSYRNVMEDMDCWFPKLKPGGLFSGHDFYTAKTGGAWCEVDSAVERWMREHRMVFSVTPCTSWWAIK